MRKILVFVALLTAVAGHAQTTDDAARSDSILSRGAQVELLNQLLPLVFTKEQWRKLLPSIEEARETVKKTQKLEADELKKIQTKLDDSYKDAVEKGELPKSEVLAAYHSTLAKLSATRRLMADMNTQKVLEAFNAIANEGQKKAAMNSLNPRDFGAVEKMKDEDKLRLFTSEILLHPLAYDIMRKLSI
jgi:hypothetical protein